MNRSFPGFLLLAAAVLTLTTAAALFAGEYKFKFTVPEVT